jgi:hypothetical protein
MVFVHLIAVSNSAYLSNGSVFNEDWILNAKEMT